MHTISSPAALATALNVLSPRMEVNFYDGRFFYVAARMLVARESPYDLERYRARLRDSAQRYPDAGAELRAEIESYPYPPASLIVFATARAPRDSACSPLWRWSSACFDAARAAAALARAGCRLRRRRLAVISNRGLEYNQPATSHGGLFLGARSAAFAAANLFLIPAGVIAVLLAAWQRERYPKHTALVAA